MNFTEKAGNSQGFYGEDHNQIRGNQIMMRSSSSRGMILPYSSSSSSSSSQQQHQHKTLVPPNYNQRDNYNWLDNDKLEVEVEEEEDTILTVADQENIRWYTGRRSAELDLMDASPVHPVTITAEEAVTAAAAAAADDDKDENNDSMMRRRGGGGRDQYSTTDDGLGLGTAAGHVMVEREHMFDKVVTPSDVGKLNRLVIPKQHAEKYFPLDSSTNEKGLLLNFEDRNGKPWRFRYSYWNSSQSYVMTKGWSRFVKEKKLDPGDIVSFQRGVGELGKDRLFIDWRRRPDHPPPELSPISFSNNNFSLPHHYFSGGFQRSGSTHPSAAAWSPGLFLPAQAAPVWRGDHYSPHSNANTNYRTHTPSYSYNYGSNSGPYNGSSTSVLNPACSSSMIYFRSGIAPQQLSQGSGAMVQLPPAAAGGDSVVEEPMVFQSVPVVQGKAAAKRLRLFGVNMDCPISDSDDCNILSSTTIPNAALMVPPHLSSTSPNIPPHLVQLRLYNGSPHPPPMQFHSDFHDKGKGI